ncbi:class I SAM-dependent methyltransferase [Planctomicrobium sp. SH661]|uniref:class I SAM-dependent methyltransferase n=1 Tax=Planctomicrobium sp. SH661 TaxID=3448124 RepID=UPI003F5CBBB8
MSNKPEGAWLIPVSGENSFECAQKRFSTTRAAEEYPSGYRDDLKGTTEKAAVLRMISYLPHGGKILDCPSGTGRVMHLLLERGFHVTASDCSEHMVNQCRENMLAMNPAWESQSEYSVQDAGATTFADKSFDGVICNRLFHHYTESESRIRVLKELARISRGPVIASFSNSFSATVWFKRLKKRLAGKKPGEKPISTRQMASEFEAAGLKVTAAVPVMWGLSRMWYMAGVPVAAQQRRAA